MALPTITRGIGFRDDLLVASVWSVLGVNGVVPTTDGDIGTFTVPSNSAGSGSQETASFSTTTYSQLLARIYNSTSNNNASLKVNYNDSTSDSFTVPLGTTFKLLTGTLTTGKTVSNIQILSTGSPNVTVVCDFILFFKETLTLPTAIRPLQERKLRNIIEIPILAKEGGQVQDLGSMSPEYTIAGGLVTTTSGQSGWTNTYTADQWWQLLKGVTIEAGTIQADGNPTWQWLASDELNGKVLLKGFTAQQVPGRLAYHDYVLSLKQFDVLGETTANLPGITY